MTERTWRCLTCGDVEVDGVIPHLVNAHGLPEGDRVTGKRRMNLHLDSAGGEYTSVYEWTVPSAGGDVSLVETLHRPPIARECGTSRAPRPGRRRR